MINSNFEIFLFILTGEVLKKYVRIKHFMQFSGSNLITHLTTGFAQTVTSAITTSFSTLIGHQVVIISVVAKACMEGTVYSCSIAT